MRHPGTELAEGTARNAAPAGPGFSLARIPFSRRGSWLALGRLEPHRAAELGKPPGIYLRTCHGGVPMADREIFLLQPGALNGADAPFAENASPSRLALAGSGRRLIEAVFSAPDTLRLRGRACTLRLSAAPRGYDFIRAIRPGSWELNLFSRRIQLLVTEMAGRLSVHAPWEGDHCLALDLLLAPDPRQPEGWWEIELREFTSTCPPHASTLPFENAVAEAAHEFSQWLHPARPVSAALLPNRDLAGYIQWSGLAAPSGQFLREAMLLSKSWMPNIWSWDHCLNAVALASRHPRLSWDQFALPFDFQNAHGALPDCINDHDIVWNFTKPPIHGWALREMMARGWTPDHAQLRQARTWLARWTEWWLRDRDEDQDGIPQYNHGNDSGWDNASVFANGTPVESPDLAAFLALQMDVLADLCERLDRTREADRWRAQATALVTRLIEHSWRGDRFVAPRSGDHSVARDSDSLLCFMPLVLGDRLPLVVREAMLTRLSAPGGFLSSQDGAATEHPASPLYCLDGHWRGPAWAPSTLLLHAGLLACGRHDLAARVADGFCAMIADSAETGPEGRRDQAHTSTASVFLLLAR